MTKGAVQKIDEKNRYSQLKYYWKTSRNKRLEKITCKCGRKVNRGNIFQHKRSVIHKQLIEARQIIE